MYITVMGLATLINSQRNATESFGNFIYTFTNNALAMADGHVVSDEMVNSFNLAYSETVNASISSIEETVAFALTSNVDPITGAIIESQMGRSLTPYALSLFTVSIVVIGIVFLRWKLNK